MSRWINDVVFYRVFCVTLLATAFIFTLILTNVFIDIDGLLLNKEKAVHYTTKSSVAVSKDKENDASMDDPNVFYNDDSNYEGDDNPAYRTKRSIETENILLHVKNPLMKKLITRRLENLLEELDKEDPKPKEESQPEITTMREKNENSKLTTEKGGREDLLHLAMHNVLLQGLIGHKDLNDIYKKVHKLLRNFKDNAAIYDEGKGLEAPGESKEMSEGSVNTDKQPSYDEEHNFLNEIIKCKQLKKEVSQNIELNYNNKTIPIEPKTDKPKKVFIKTIIEINEDNHLKKSNLKDVEGLIRLIYNGKPIKFNQMTDDPPKLEKRQNNRDVEEVTVSNYINYTEVTERLPLFSKKQNKNPLNMVIEEYLTKHPFLNYLEDGAEMKTFHSKRLKRQIKIRYFNNNKTSPFKSKQSHNKTKKAEDDLYIEIETHFDGKGLKGEKKKKLVKNLIEKIQKALHSDIEQPDDKERIKFIKRVQDPIDFKEHSSFMSKILPAYEPIGERQLDPIIKTLDTHANIINRFGEKWKKKVVGPSFLTVSKSVNSAEMRELNINYDAVAGNGIPKRLQKPLNTDLEEDFTTTSTNMGNVSLFLKDIDGTGFSIGINQYVGEPPDKDSMKIFNGLESLIKEYHKTYDHEEVSNESNIDKADNFVEKDHKLGKRGIDYKQDDLKEIISKTDPDFHSNTYKLLYNNIFGSFSKYASLFKNYKFKDVKRNKRAMTVKKISNLNSKIKLNRYINTKTMSNKRIFRKNKRNKRQVQNIRIIARDHSETSPKHSDENIFLISRENPYSDRASVVRQINEPENVKDKKNQDMYEEALPFGDFYKMQNPEELPLFSENEYDTKVRPSLTMSRYPHIFRDDINKNEDYNSYHSIDRNLKNNKPYRIKHSPKQTKLLNRMESTTSNSVMVSENEQKGNDFVDSIVPPTLKTKYKVSVKITPKNISTNSGFKEVHTSVNKSYDQNGLRYFSLLNVSQISKIEKLNKTEIESDLKNTEANSEPYNDHFKKQQQQMKILLRLHKKRVDQQLGNLIKESKHLERMMEDSSKMSINKTINILNDDGEVVDKLRDEKINTILNSVKNLEETYKAVSTTTLGTTTLQSTTLMPIESDNMQLIDTIKLNEKVTYEILKKIDSNTNILKAFLQKLQMGAKIDKQTAEKTFGEVKLDLTKDWKSYKVRNPFFVGDETKNGTLPFVYAYQQPIPIKGNTPPLASLMYHGHIHTNALQDIHDNNFKKPSNNNSDLDKNNSTHFAFISDNNKKKTTSA